MNVPAVVEEEPLVVEAVEFDELAVNGAVWKIILCQSRLLIGNPALEWFGLVDALLCVYLPTEEPATEQVEMKADCAILTALPLHRLAMAD